MTDERINTAIRRASLLLLVLFVAAALITGYWQVATGAALSARKDNPRLVLAERQISRGAILDRNGNPLAVSQRTSEGYVRYYPEPSAAPVVGYYSLRYGLGGAEEAFDADLRGLAGQTRLDQYLNQVLHRVPPGRSVRLTLDASVQRAADQALGSRAGAVVVLSVPEGQVIALVSHPTFDPATLDQDWERLVADPAAPLLNRATQGLYQPGAAFQSVVLSEMLTRGVAHLTDTVSSEVAAPIMIAGQTLECAEPPGDKTLAAAFLAACPAQFASLADRVSSDQMTQLVRRWGLVALPDPYRAQSITRTLALDAPASTQSVRDLALGQGLLTVSPLQMASVIGIIANHGRAIASPRLTARPVDASQSMPVVSAQVADAIQATLASETDDYAGQTALAISGKTRLVWFLGLAPAQSPRWAFAILIETPDPAAVHSIAQAVRAKLQP
jgi:peptidoglycan glycosyltransferase